MASSARAATAVSAHFYRGGTSRGLFFRTKSLESYTHAQRDAIICRAMGSPDPDGRQISGLGGGVSSLSKCAVVGPPGASCHSGERAFPGLKLVDSIEQSRDSKHGWDVVYRFGQVPINGTEIDWGSTCGNLVAAAAMFAIDSEAVSQSTLQERMGTASGPYEGIFPLRIIAANSGNIVTANVPLELQSQPGSSLILRAARTGTARIAGVPGAYAPISIETPLPERAAILPSGNARDRIIVQRPGGGDSLTVDVSLVDCGLPVIFVSAASLGISLDLLLAHPAELDAHAPTMALLEAVRTEGGKISEKVWNNFSPPAPKVCIVHPRIAYKTTGGDDVAQGHMDLLIRSISVGNVHRTIPATTLSAVAAASAYSDSVVAQAVAEGRAGGLSAPAPASAAESNGAEDVVSITVGQPAGLSTASVKLDSQRREPQSIVYVRTANRIISGEIDVPSDLV